MLPAQETDTDEIDALGILVRTLEKTIRQRDYWRMLANRWEREAEDPDDPVMDRGIFVVRRCAKDLDFILDRAMGSLPESLQDEIQARADKVRTRIIEARRLGLTPVDHEE